MKLRLPWQKESAVSTAAFEQKAACTHPRVEVELHGTAIKRRWCAACGQELPVAERSAED